MATNGSLESSITNRSSTFINGTIFISALSMVAVATVALNGLFMFALIKKRSLHNPSNALLGVLSTVDLFTGLIAMPLRVNAILSTNCFDCSPVVMELGTQLSWLFLGISFLLLALISIDRYAAICHPFKYLQYASIRAYMCISGAACLVLIGLSSYVVYTDSKKANTVKTITINASAVLMLGIISFTNFKIFKAIRKQRTTVAHVAVHNRADLQQRGQKITNDYIILFIIFIFIACFVPYLVAYNLPNKLEVTCHIGSYPVTIKLQRWFSFPAYLNCLINPLVYYFRISYFRKAIKEVACCK